MPSWYHKAKYDFDWVMKEGFDTSPHAYVIYGYAVGWLTESPFVNDYGDINVRNEIEKTRSQLKSKSIEPPEIYEWYDGCFAPDLFIPEARPFADFYFDFGKGNKNDYSYDYFAIVKPCECFIFSWDTYEKMKQKIEFRLQEFTEKQK